MLVDQGPIIGKQGSCLFFIVLDAGWLTSTPSVGLFGMCVALACQTYCIFHPHVRHAEFAIEVSLWLWILGNAFWMSSEYLWDGPQPEGFLAEISFLKDWSSSWYLPFMRLATVIMLLSVVVNGIGLSMAFAGHSPEKTAPTLLDVPEYRVFGLPLAIYLNLYVTPWLLQDALWCLNNVLTLYSTAKPPYWGPIMLLLGSASLVVGVDCVRRMVRKGDRMAITISGGELFLILGNLFWSFEDVQLYELHVKKVAKACALCCFLAGMVVMSTSCCLRR